MNAGGRDLVATDEPTIFSKPFLDAIIVENGQGNRGFPDPPWTDESDWCEVFSEINNLLDQPVTSKTSPRWRGRRFPRRYAVQK